MKRVQDHNVAVLAQALCLRVAIRLATTRDALHFVPIMPDACTTFIREMNDSCRAAHRYCAWHAVLMYKRFKAPTAVMAANCETKAGPSRGTAVRARKLTFDLDLLCVANDVFLQLPCCSALSCCTFVAASTTGFCFAR